MGSRAPKTTAAATPATLNKVGYLMLGEAVPQSP